MAYNETLANRVREIIADAGEENVEEKTMFGGLCFMVNNKICVAVKKDSMLVRLNPNLYEQALEKEGVTPMARQGTGMKGYIFVSDEFLQTQPDLQYWVKLALQFNPIAKASKK
ncbi:TfoX/Sxy family transcriptional regulator of competence genes [Mucilaginibacter gracilis]|uniref:TfoX/Sxy family transcriptional regulator of competence genes n=1 Tax=Mucilaginibacter gracilis TaxID=423350 RepID=A0A495J8H6_9SPHI|nr:TfoX/Sxy family protein [Mucilaginibacter gracilis]RKR85073.1 TfoX/Sxy family transcriptional regulator of competence genes [Mucilaginibacter gracilis]